LAGRRFDWQPAAARNPEAWVCHVLRREAESMILPNLPAFLEGKYQPKSNDERLALLPACQFNKRPGAGATLFSEILATDTVMADDLGSGIRYDAACFAALAGCGIGDGADLDDAKRAQWREQSRRWLRADLATLAKLIDTIKSERRVAIQSEAQRWLTHCQVDTDLAGLREPKALAGFTRAEQTDCFVLWDEVATVLRRARAIE